MCAVIATRRERGFFFVSSPAVLLFAARRHGWSLLRSGNFSTVRLGVHRKTGQQVAIKVIDKKKYWHIAKTRAQILREVEILKGLKHPNIIEIVEVVDGKRYLYMVLEL